MKLLPLSEFVEEYFKDKQVEWNKTAEYVLHTAAANRVKIVFETIQTPDVKDEFVDFWRSDTLIEQGVAVDCEDAKEFAQRLLDTLFYHMSPHQTQHIINALQRSLDEWEEERAQKFAENPKVFGNIPPTSLSDICPD